MRAFVWLAFCVMMVDAQLLVIKKMNDKRRKAAESYGITNMKDLQHSDRLDAIAKTLSCSDLEHHGSDYRVFLSGSSKDVNYENEMGKTEIFFRGGFKAGIKVLETVGKPIPNMIEMFTPTQTDTACRKLDCTFDNGGKPYSSSTFCLVGPSNAIKESDFLINGEPLSKHDKSEVVFAIESLRDRFAKAVGISNMHSLFYDLALAKKAKKVAEECLHKQDLASILIVPQYDVHSGSAFSEYYFETEQQWSAEKTIEIVDKMAALDYPKPNIIDLLNPEHTKIGCVPADCSEWKAGPDSLKDVTYVCALGPIGKSTRDHFKFTNFVPPPVAAPALPSEPTTQKPTTAAPILAPRAPTPPAPPPEPKEEPEVATPQAAPLVQTTRRVVDEEEEDDEDDEDLEESASATSILLSLVVSLFLI